MSVKGSGALIHVAEAEPGHPKVIGTGLAGGCGGSVAADRFRLFLYCDLTQLVIELVSVNATCSYQSCHFTIGQSDPCPTPCFEVYLNEKMSWITSWQVLL